MAHRSRQPQRLESLKKSKPRDRGEKYVAPLMLPDENEPPSARLRDKNKSPGGTISSERRRRRLARKGPAHELVRKLKPAELKSLAKP